MFYSAVPDGFSRVDDIRLDGGSLTIEDRSTGRTLKLRASRSL
jgi:hypothetical protein